MNSKIKFCPMLTGKEEVKALMIGQGDCVMLLHDASVVRKWVNGKGIGGIAKAENKEEYTLDAIGDVEIRQNKVLFEIPCEW